MWGEGRTFVDGNKLVAVVGGCQSSDGRLDCYGGFSMEPHPARVTATQAMRKTEKQSKVDGLRFKEEFAPIFVALIYPLVFPY